MDAKRQAQSDNELLAAYLKGGPEAATAFERLVERHGGMVFHACLRVLGVREAAEDASQAVFLVLARKAGTVRGSTGAFLHAVAMHVAIRARRDEALRQTREKEAAEVSVPRENAGDGAGGGGWPDVRPHLDRAIGELPRGQRAAVVLHYLEGRPRREVAEALGISEGAAASHLSRALDRLRRLLAGKGRGLSAAALAPMLAACSTEAACPQFLLESGKIIAGGGAATLSPNVSALAKGAVKAMFWTKVKMVASVVVGLAVAGGGTGMVLHAAHGGEPAVEKDAEGRIKAKDNKGREWLLEDWKEGTAKFPAPEDAAKYKEWLKDVTRPYPKDLKEREAWYLKKWGENWDGPRFTDRILTPGDWKWEEIPLPEDLAMKIGELPPDLANEPTKVYWRPFGGCWPSGHVYAPVAGEATDFYGTTRFGFVHLDLKTRKFAFIGKLDGTTKERFGCQDGIGDAVRITGTYGGEDVPTVDNVTGRLFFRQGVSQTANALRSVEKLLPYKDKAGGKEYLLPAFLDARDLYKKVKSPAGGELEPVMKDGKRADPAFAVRTMKQVGHHGMVGPSRGQRTLLTPDGKGLHISREGGSWGGMGSTHMKLNELAFCDLETGKRSPVEFRNASELLLDFSKGGSDPPGSHGGICTGIDGIVYAAQHGGCAFYPMRLISFDPQTGKGTVLYHSIWGKWDRKIGSQCWDGPADAQYLLATSTLQQTQCPRTGAILNGGWDSSGFRRYHDGFVTSVFAGNQGGTDRARPGPAWNGKTAPTFSGHSLEVGVAPNGDMYVPYADAANRILRYYRTDWPKEQPEYGYGEKFMPKARLEELMLEYARTYIANYEANSKF
jgi:RNA polymerase sigma factor (sigma-70 family)